MSNSQIRILIVEDSAVQAEAIRRTLVAEGYSVTVAKDGVDGLAKAKALKPELVISDILMPEMNGFDLCRHIKNDADISSTPVILLTSLSDPADVISGLECGADNFITKPYEEKYLISRIRYMLLSREFQKGERTRMGVEVHFADRKYFITSEKKQILDLLISTYESAVQKNLQLAKAQEELQMLNEKLEERVKERTAELRAEITERKRAEEMLLKVNRAYKTLSECNQILVRITDEPGLLCEICRIIVEDGGYRMALVGYAEQDEQKTVRVMAQMGYEEDFFKTVNLTWADTERGHGPLGTTIRTRTPSIFQNIATESKILSWREAALKRGYASAIGLPLIAGSDLLGALAIYSAEPYAFDEEEIKLLTELADDLVYGIMTLRTRAEHKKAEEALRESEAKYRNLTESLDELIYRADPETFVVTYVNSAVERIYGYTVEEWLRDPTLWESTIYPENKEKVLAEFAEAHRKMESGVVEYRIIRKDKTVRWVEDHLSWEKDQQGNVVSLNGMLYDITERKRAEEAIERLRHRNELILNSAGEGILGLDLQGNHTFVNPAAARMLGYEVEELIGRQSHTIWHHSRTDGSPYPEEECPIYAVHRDGAVHTKADEVFWRKDGTSFPVRYTSTPILEDGNIIGAVVTFRDITERKRAEEALKESEEKFRELASSAQDAIIMMDNEGNFFYCNEAFERIFGFSSIEILGKEMHTIIVPERYYEDYKKGFARFRETGKGPVIGKTLELVAVKKDGTEFPIELSVSALQFKGKWMSIGILRDITKRKQAEEALQRAHDELEIRVSERTKELEGMNLELEVLNKELSLRRVEAEDAKLQAEAATRAKSDFLANMSHELRTPLNAIIGFSDMMVRGMTGKLTEQQIEYLGDIRESGELLLSLINDILDLSKVEAGKIELDLSEFNLKELIERSLVMFKEKAMKHNIKVKYEVDERIGSITADERRLKQVMFNLLSNAVKFTPDGGYVSVRARLLEVKKMGRLEDEKRHDTQLLNFLSSQLPDRNFIEISVEDTGSGIKPEDFDKIFQPFQQLEYALTKEYEGTGLGLTLCKRIVELHNGRIWVESEVGKGSKFIFVIPIRQLRSQSSQQEGFR